MHEVLIYLNSPSPPSPSSMSMSSAPLLPWTSCHSYSWNNSSSMAYFLRKMCIIKQVMAISH
uniref:Uncharacterized protein n=1 Tax=Nelumbo nucifera TaxID=4432 RepID=A0A822Y5Z3_NELNU|nr:TPA_asm: hypothetical protein HUJ06_029120 [Nelumbo nucifera]